jgi:hypothetical protein
MTISQRIHLYFPAWNQACKARGWRMQRGCLVGTREECFASPELDEVYQTAWDAAGLLAIRLHHGVTLDDLRHGQHIAVLGRDISATDIDNLQLDKIMAWFRILADPENLDAVMEFSNPTISQKRRYVASIQRLAPQAYIHAICAGKFGKLYHAPDWEDLPIWALRQLIMTLKARKPVQQAAMVPAGDSDPF